MNHSCSRVFLQPKADSAGDIKKALLYGTKRRRRQSPAARIRLNNIFLLPPPAGLLRGCVYACCIRSFAVPKPKKQLFPNKLPLLSRSLGFGGKTSNRATDAFIGLCSLLPATAKLLLLGCMCVGKTRTCVASLSHRRRGHS